MDNLVALLLGVALGLGLAKVRERLGAPKEPPSAGPPPLDHFGSGMPRRG